MTTLKIEKKFSCELKSYYVYLHIRKSDGQVFYVGKGHKDRWRTIENRNNYWKNTANRYGVVCEIVANSLSEHEALLLETKLISLYGRRDLNTGSLVNMTSGGDGVVGYVFTSEHKQKLSEAGKGRLHSEESKVKISESHKGKTKTESHRESLSKARKGKSWTKSQRESGNDKLNKRSRRVLCVETGKEYESISRLAKDMNIDSSGVTKVCVGKRKHFKNFTFKFID